MPAESQSSSPVSPVSYYQSPRITMCPLDHAPLFSRLPALCHELWRVANPVIRLAARGSSSRRLTP